MSAAASAAASLRERSESYARDAQRLFRLGDKDAWVLYDTIARELLAVAEGLDTDA